MGLNDAEKAPVCTNLHEEAVAVIDKLGKFKVVPATLKAFKAQIDLYDGLQTSPRDGIAQGAAATKRLVVLFRKLRKLLKKQLDPLIAPFKQTDPTLYHEYKFARKIVNAPTTHIVDPASVAPDAVEPKAA
jgi:hypothetical protein